MTLLRRPVPALALLAMTVASLGLPVAAQTGPGAGTSASREAERPAPTAPAGRATDDADLRHEPAVQRIVVEDDGARIEELRVRGQTQRVIVRPKAAGAAAYEIIVPTAGRDTSAGPGANRGAAGQRVWSLLAF